MASWRRSLGGGTLQGSWIVGNEVRDNGSDGIFIGLNNHNISFFDNEAGGNHALDCNDTSTGGWHAGDGKRLVQQHGQFELPDGTLHAWQRARS